MFSKELKMCNELGTGDKKQAGKENSLTAGRKPDKLVKSSAETALKHTWYPACPERFSIIEVLARLKSQKELSRAGLQACAPSLQERSQIVGKKTQGFPLLTPAQDW